NIENNSRMEILWICICFSALELNINTGIENTGLWVLGEVPGYTGSFRVTSFIFCPSQEIVRRNIYAQPFGSYTGSKNFRKAVRKQDVFQPQIGSILQIVGGTGISSHPLVSRHINCGQGVGWVFRGPGIPPFG